MNKTANYVVFAAIVIATFLTVINSNMVRLASPHLQAELNVSYSNLSWVFNSYQIAYAILLPVFGLIGDKFGRKYYLVAGVAIFGLGALLAGLAWDFTSLVIFRTLQAVGAAAIYPNALVAGTGLFPPEHSGKVMGIWGMAVSMASVLGPTIGGFIVQYLGWQYIFFMNVPFAVLSSLIIHFMFKSDRRKPQEFHFDYRGTVILGAMIILLIAGLQAGSEGGWSSPRAMIMLAGFAACLPLFKKIEENCDQPVIDLEMFRNRAFLSAVYVGCVHLIAIQGLQFLMPIYLASVKGFDAVKIGFMLLPQAIVRLAVSPIAGMLEDRFGPKVPIAAGLAIRSLALASIGLLTPHSTNTVITLTLLLDGLGAALMWSPSLNAAINSSPKEKASSATGLFNTIRLIAASTSMVLVGLAMDKLFTAALQGASGPVSGFFHVYMAFATLAAVGLITTRYLKVHTPEEERVKLLQR